MAKLGRDGTAGSSTGGSRASITAGKQKAINRVEKTAKKQAAISSVPRIIGKDTNLKGSNKKIAKAKKELGTFGTAIQKHPLIRNTGQSSAEGKYRYNGGKSIPVKRSK